MSEAFWSQLITATVTDKSGFHCTTALKHLDWTAGGKRRGFHWWRDTCSTNIHSYDEFLPRVQIISERTHTHAHTYTHNHLKLWSSRQLGPFYLPVCVCVREREREGEYGKVMAISLSRLLHNSLSSPSFSIIFFRILIHITSLQTNASGTIFVSSNTVS